jgi:flavin reductase (DIM6/NTAB) family NADH-FMN oxidoreductase RutF
MVRWTLRLAAAVFMAGGILMIAVKDANGHPVGIPVEWVPWLSWVVIIAGCAFLLISFMKDS